MNNISLNKSKAIATSSKQKQVFTLTGKVVNDSLDKTITVDVVNKFRHPVYQKTIFKNKKYLVHDPLNQAKVGDRVVIANARKFSARKSFYLLKILNSATKQPTNSSSSTTTDNESTQNQSEVNK